MPPMNGAEWLALFQKGAAESVGGAASFPQHITLRTPMLSLGNQQWNNLSIVSQPTANGTLVEAQGREINATLAMRNNAPWLANIKYLYYNPSVAKTRGDSTQSSPSRQRSALTSVAGRTPKYDAQSAGSGGKIRAH